VEFVRAKHVLGAVIARVRSEGENWREIRQSNDELTLISTFKMQDDVLAWEVGVKNVGTKPLEIGDLELPLPLNTEYVWDHAETFERRVFRHAFVAGQGSFLYWLPVKGGGPMLVLQPEGSTGLEFFTATDMDYAFGREKFSVFIHAKATAEKEHTGTWRWPRTSRVLAPGQSCTYRLAFRWASTYQEVRDLLARHGGVDVHVLPGAVVPRDLPAQVALRSLRKGLRLEAEFPGETSIEERAGPTPEVRIFQVKFARLGENLLTVRGDDGWTMPLEFFVTEPLETLVQKRAAFIVNKQQHRDPSVWYDGLYSLWDRREPAGRHLLGPDHLAGQHPYAVSGSDDPSNSKCLLVAEKNVAYPDAREVESLEYFIQHFVWGKHQRTDQEIPYPYGIYGADSWQQNRSATRDPLSEGVSRPGGPSACRMWRTFDYTTYFALYFDMYRIARQRPDLVKTATARQYLERACGTARAYFDVPSHIRMEGGWSFTGWVYWAYTVGNFHEKYLLPLIAALEAEGMNDQARVLRAEWEKKVKYFIYDHPWPFASEMPIDSTAYESTYAAASYALERGLQPDHDLWVDRNSQKGFSHPVIDRAQHERFLHRQHLANLACRGVLEPHYWSLGSDFRGCGASSYTLSYMSAMGGWAVLDYGLHYDADPAPSLRLGYASMLSMWALMNSGDAASSYGYWTPGPLHDGAMSWGFQPRQVGTEWNPATRDLPRGAWPICGEADHGLVAAIEAACTVLYEDPLFGWVALGGDWRPTTDGMSFVPRDGVRQRFHVRERERWLHVALDRDGFASGEPVRVGRGFDRLSFVLENRGVGAHEVAAKLEGLPQGRYQVTAGRGRWTIEVPGAGPVTARFSVEESRTTAVEINPVR